MLLSMKYSVLKCKSTCKCKCKYKYCKVSIEYFPYKDVIELHFNILYFIDNNSRAMRDFTWRKADTVILLDLPCWLIFYRLVIRTFYRWYSGEVICNGNKENLYDNLCTRDSVFYYSFRLTTWKRSAFLDDLKALKCPVIRIVSPSDCESFLADFREKRDDAGRPNVNIPGQ